MASRGSIRSTFLWEPRFFDTLYSSGSWAENAAAAEDILFERLSWLQNSSITPAEQEALDRAAGALRSVQVERLGFPLIEDEVITDVRAEMYAETMFEQLVGRPMLLRERDVISQNRKRA